MSNGVAYYLNKFYKKQIKEKNINVEELGISQKLSKGKIIFRGQANENWSVMSSAGRRLFKTGSYKQKEFIGYHVNLIENARKFGYGDLKAGTQLNDLEILAQIQHYGGATCLVDFTSNFLIALWIATEKNNVKRDFKLISVESKIKETNSTLTHLLF